MIKVINNSFNFQEKPLSVIGGSKRFGFEKTASKNQKILDHIAGLKHIQGRTFFHVLFLGAGEFYGSNLNGDWFGVEDLKTRYDTFMKFGKFYRHHKNKDPQKSYGDIPFSTYCDTMKRVEGIVSLENAKCEDILKRYEEGDDIPVSMAAKLKYDICSICGHKSKSLSEYCDHLKYEMNRIYPDGRKVYAINPDPIFFDISFVYKPADPTAYFFSKVASGESPMEHLSAYWGEYYYGNDSMEKDAFDKLSFLRKMSELEKHIDSIVAGKVDNDSIKPILSKLDIDGISGETIDKMKELPFGGLLKTLTCSKLMLTPEEFFGILGFDSIIPEIKSKLPGCFSRMLDGCDRIKDFDIENFDSASPIKISEILKMIPRSRIVDDDFIGKNISNDKSIEISFGRRPSSVIKKFPGGFSSMTSGSSGKIIIKTSENKKNIIADKLAKIYNLYKVSFCKKNPSKVSILYSVISNYN